MSELAKRVPLPTSEEDLVHMMWPSEALWRTQRRIDHAAAERGRVARDVQKLVFDAMRPGERQWGDALAAWEKAEAAYSCGAWDSYVAHETEALDVAGVAIAKARERHASRIDGWLEVFNEHARAFDERRIGREEEQAQRRAEQDARRQQREAQERPPRSARAARRRTARQRTTSAGPRSIVDLIANGSPKDWAALLGVTPICSREELKRAHRDAARRHHPDLGGDEELMKAVNIAQKRLGDMLEIYWAAGVI